MNKKITENDLYAKLRKEREELYKIIGKEGITDQKVRIDKYAHLYVLQDEMTEYLRARRLSQAEIEKLYAVENFYEYIQNYLLHHKDVFNYPYIPPAFGSPTSYTLNAGELLTPNLVSGSVAGTTSGTGGVTVLLPMTSGSSSGNTGSYTPVKYTAVTKDLYYSGGYLGTLKIPTLGLSVKVYQGTDADALRKGAGHFASTSIWEGNVAIAGHNRGVNNHFGKIHTLDIGDTIKLTTQLGTRSYEVYSVSKIGVDDTSVLNDSTENIITLVTCVMNQPDYRWCVQARQK